MLELQNLWRNDWKTPGQECVKVDFESYGLGVVAQVIFFWLKSKSLDFLRTFDFDFSHDNNNIDHWKINFNFHHALHSCILNMYVCSKLLTRFFSSQSKATITNVRLFISSFVLKTPFNLNPSSFIILPSSFNLHDLNMMIDWYMQKEMHSLRRVVLKISKFFMAYPLVSCYYFNNFSS